MNKGVTPLATLLNSNFFRTSKILSKVFDEYEKPSKLPVEDYMDKLYVVLDQKVSLFFQVEKILRVTYKDILNFCKVKSGSIVKTIKNALIRGKPEGSKKDDENKEDNWKHHFSEIIGKFNE